MEFSYRISESQFLAGWKLWRSKSSRSGSLRSVGLWVAILVCLSAVWVYVSPSYRVGPSGLGPPIYRTGSGEMLAAALPAITFVCLFVILYLRRVGPVRVRNIYRKDPAMQNEITAEVTPQSISTRIPAGATSTAQWTLYDYWCESGELIVLVLLNGSYQILNIVRLSSAQRDELRTILSAALRKK